MEFRIADIFTDSLARLTGDEQKAVMIHKVTEVREAVVSAPEELDSGGSRARSVQQKAAASPRLPRK